MPVITATIILIISVLVYILLKQIHSLVADFYLLVLFVFSYILTQKSFSLFYILLFLVVIVIDLGISQFSIEPAKSIKIGSMSYKGFTMVIISAVLGLVMYLIISGISIVKGGNIIGAPELQITTSGLAQNFRPTFVGMLGIIENRFAFVGFEILNIFGYLVPLIGIAFKLIPYLLPVVITGLLMGILHITAYSVAASLILWATFAFIIFILSYIITKDSLAADIAHILNNALIDLKRGLAIVAA